MNQQHIINTITRTLQQQFAQPGAQALGNTAVPQGIATSGVQQTPGNTDNLTEWQKAMLHIQRNQCMAHAPPPNPPQHGHNQSPPGGGRRGGGQYHIGENVEARWSDNHWYPAVVTADHGNDTFGVRYTQDNVRANNHASAIRRPNAVVNHTVPASVQQQTQQAILGLLQAQQQQQQLQQQQAVQAMFQLGGQRQLSRNITPASRIAQQTGMYIPSNTLIPNMPGFEFKTGEHGMGMYRTNQQVAPQIGGLAAPAIAPRFRVHQLVNAQQQNGTMSQAVVIADHNNGYYTIRYVNDNSAAQHYLHYTRLS